MKHNKLSPNINKCTPAYYQPITIHRRLSESIQWWLLYISLKFIAHSKMHLKKATSKPYRVWESVWGAVITRQTIKNNKRNEECRTTICRVEVKGGVNQTRGQTTVKGKIWQQVEWNLYVCFFYLVPVSTSFCSRLSRVGGSRAHRPTSDSGLGFQVLWHPARNQHTPIWVVSSWNQEIIGWISPTERTARGDSSKPCLCGSSAFVLSCLSDVSRCVKFIIQ